jgi:DENN (AEX-3) domain
MSLGSLGEKYAKKLKANIQIRQEIQELTQNISDTQDINKNNLETISSLQDQLFQLQSQIKKSNDLKLNEINSFTGMYSNLSMSIRYSLKKLLTQDSETPTSDVLQTFDHSSLDLFENFFVIGLNQKENYILEPFELGILFSYPQKATVSEKTLKKIKKSAFPNGISPVAFKMDESINSQVCEALYHSYYRKGNSFTAVFPSEVSKKPFGFIEMRNNEKECIYCCYVMFYELCMSSTTHSQLIVPRCYCFLTYFPCFELHFEVLYRLLSIKRAERFRIINSEKPVPSFQCLVNEELGLIENYYSYLTTRLFEKTMRVYIPLQIVESVDYSFPLDYSLLDQLWFCPLLFSLITAEDFYYMLCCVLQEKRIVFLSQNKDHLTACVLGFLSLISPFKWQHPVVPIYYNSKLISKSICFIVGVLEGVPDCLQGQDFIFFNLDTDKNTRLNCFDCCFPYSYNLLDAVRDFFQVFGDRPCYLPDDKQIEATKKIINTVKIFVKWILNEILAYCSTGNMMDFQIYKEIIKKHAGKDSQFFSNVLSTDMFMHAYAL